MIQPNYEHCINMEYWGFNTAALILSDICPIKYRSVRVLERDIPVEFERARELYYILKSIPWDGLYSDYFVKGKGMRPAAVIAIAKSKRMNVPLELLKFAEEIHQDELAEINNLLIHRKKRMNNATADLGNRERKSWQLGLGLMIRLYAKKIGKLSDSSEVNISSSQLNQLLLDEAEKIGVSLDGLKSFDRKITQTLEFIADESNL